MLLNQLRRFYNETFPESMEILIVYFAVFGESGIEIDTTVPLPELIETKILDHYGEHYNRIHTGFLEDRQVIALLQAVAKGDRRIHSACRRAHISEAKGGEFVDHLRTLGILDLEASREAPPKKEYPKQKLKREIARHRISHKLRFRSPFLRFWFRFVSPQHRRIERGDYESVLSRFAEQDTAFTGLVFEEISQLYLRRQLGDDPFLRCGSYWDRVIELDILARAPGGGFIVGECKWTNSNVNKGELQKLQEKCALVGLEPEQIWLFAKRGFSNELEAMRSDTLVLVCAEEMKELIE
ncbi:MAG: DUF234 domain-containing protein [Campylobacterales bacterium]|nr:DUF234 domain-containing protein [Campylobacterales bacterium]